MPRSRVQRLQHEAQDKPTTTQRGYGYEHQRARARALRQLRDGDPCGYCDQPMSRDMDLDYDHFPAMAEGGRPDGPRRLTHATCNRRAGQAIAMARREREKPRSVNSRAW